MVELPLLAVGEMEGGSLVCGVGGPVRVNGALQAGGGERDVGLDILDGLAGGPVESGRPDGEGFRRDKPGKHAEGIDPAIHPRAQH